MAQNKEQNKQTRTTVHFERSSVAFFFRLFKTGFSSRPSPILLTVLLLVLLLILLLSLLTVLLLSLLLLVLLLAVFLLLLL